MKGKIDKLGYLYINKGSNIILQRCKPGGMESNGQFGGCGCDCPLFGEPITSTTTAYYGYDTKGRLKAISEGESSLTTLEICTHRILIFDQFEDER